MKYYKNVYSHSFHDRSLRNTSDIGEVLPFEPMKFNFGGLVQTVSRLEFIDRTWFKILAHNKKTGFQWFSKNLDSDRYQLMRSAQAEECYCITRFASILNWR